MEGEGLGFRFYARLAAVVFAGAVVAWVLLLIFSRAIIAWGVLGAFLALSAVLLAFAWIYDRRQAREM